MFACVNLEENYFSAVHCCVTFHTQFIGKYYNSWSTWLGIYLVADATVFLNKMWETISV